VPLILGSDQRGFTLVEILISLAVIAINLVGLGAVIRASLDASKRAQVIATRDAVVDSIRRAASSPLAMHRTANETINAPLLICVNGGCAQNAIVDYNLFDAGGTRIAGTSSNPVHYYADGSVAPSSLNASIKATVVAYIRCPAGACITANVVIESHYSVGTANNAVTIKTVTAPYAPVPATKILDHYY
jgi:prepilin-type N-terminal cleavage/methylation domain-containing protein